MAIMRMNKDNDLLKQTQTENKVPLWKRLLIVVGVLSATTGTGIGINSTIGHIEQNRNKELSLISQLNEHPKNIEDYFYNLRINAKLAGKEKEVEEFIMLVKANLKNPSDVKIINRLKNMSGKITGSFEMENFTPIIKGYLHLY